MKKGKPRKYGALKRDLTQKVCEGTDHYKTQAAMELKFDSVKKEHGLFFTPEWIVDFMVKISSIKVGGSVLEPACGLGQFLSKIIECKFKSEKPDNIQKSVTGVELLPELADNANMYINNYLSDKSISSGIKLNIKKDNFLLLNEDTRYDLIIGNPPYGIMASSRHYAIPVTAGDKAKYKDMFETWRGKYNIYGAFIEKSVRILKDKGMLTFVVPATFMILNDYITLRKYLSKAGKISIYYIGDKAFKSAAVTTVILQVEKGKKGLDLYEINGRTPSLVYSNEKYDGGLMRFENDFTGELEKSSIRLDDLFYIKIAARSPEIKKCQYVSDTQNEGYLPILKGTNLKKNVIIYDDKPSGKWIHKDKVNELRNYYTQKRIVIGHTKGGSLEAAVEDRKYPWMGDVYQLIPKKKDINLEDIVNVLNSGIMDRYVKTLYKKISPHITADQLRIMPVISLKTSEVIEKKYA